MPLCDAWETPQDSEPHPATGPAATTHSRTRGTRVPHRPCAREETTRRQLGHLLPPERRPMDVIPTAARSARNHNDPERANLAQKRTPSTTQRRAAPRHNPATPVRQTHRREIRQPARHMQQIPEDWGLASASRGVEHERKPNDFLLHPPGRDHASQAPATCLQQRKGRRHTPTRPSTSPSSPASRTDKGPGKGPGQTRGTHGRADGHQNVNEQSSGVFPSNASVPGYVHRGDRPTPPPGKLNAWDAWGVTAHITYANATRDTLPAEG